MPILLPIVEINPAQALDPAPPFARLELSNLFNIAQWQHEIPWQPIKDGLEIYQIYGVFHERPFGGPHPFQQGEQGAVPHSSWL